MKYKAISNYIEEFALWPGGQAWVYILMLSFLLGLALFMAFAGEDEEPVDLPSKQLPHGEGRWKRFLDHTPPWIRGRAAFLVLIFLIILFGRSPALLVEAINIDESSYLAASITLDQGGLYWKDVDSLSSGPMIAFLGWAPKLLGLNIDYSSFRFVGFLVLAATWFLFYRTLALFFNDRLSRLITLGGVVYRGFMTEGGFLAMHSETPPILVTMVAVYFLAKLGRAERGKPLTRTAFWLGLTLGVLPYSKIQSVPLGLIFAVWGGLFLLWRFRGRGAWRPDWRKAAKPLGLYVFAGVLPTLVVLVYLVTFADPYMFWRSYVVDNLVYRQIPQLADASINYPFPTFLYAMPEMIMEYNQMSHLMVGCALVLFLALAGFYLRPVKAPAYWVYGMGLAVLFLLGTILIIILPGRPYAHYLEYLPTPLLMVTGFALAHALRASQEPAQLPAWSRNAAAALAVGILTLPGAFQSLRTSPERVTITQPENFKKPPPYFDYVLRPYYEPGDSALSFIYNPEFHVYSGLKMAEPRPMQNRLILKGTDISYFVDRFYDMMRNDPPEYVVDHTAGSWNDPGYQDRLAELGKIIREDYVHFLDLEALDLYVRRDRFEKYPGMQRAREKLQDIKQREYFERRLGEDGVRDQLDPRIAVPRTRAPGQPPASSPSPR